MNVYLDFAKHVILTVFTLLYLPLSFIIPPTDSYDAKDPEALKTSFTVLSDIHIEGNNYQTFKEYSEILKEVNNSKNNDTLVFLGDNTMNGQDIESIFFFGALALSKPAENLIIAPGNHDYANGTGGYDKMYERFNNYANFAGCKIEKNNYCKSLTDTILLFSQLKAILSTELTFPMHSLNGSKVSLTKQQRKINLFLFFLTIL